MPRICKFCKASHSSNKERFACAGAHGQHAMLDHLAQQDRLTKEVTGEMEARSNALFGEKGRKTGGTIPSIDDTSQR